MKTQSHSSQWHDPLYLAAQTIEKNALQAADRIKSGLGEADGDARELLSAVADIQLKYASVARKLADALARAEMLMTASPAR